MISTKFMLSNALTCLGLKVFYMFIANIIVSFFFLIFNPLFESCLFEEMINWIKAQFKDPC